MNRPGRQQLANVDVAAAASPRQQGVLDPDLLALLETLHAGFEPRRQELLARRRARQAALDGGATLAFLPETEDIRNGSWRVAPPPHDLADRRVEITGPAERKTIINGLNAGAQVFMADFEDSLSPTWGNVLEGQANLAEAVRGTLTLDTPDGRHYEVRHNPATLVVRPRGWHLVEPRITIRGQPMSASLFDAAAFILHNGKTLRAHGSAPYLYLPKMESRLEARLWNEVLAAIEEHAGLPPGAVRVSVLIETLPAAFEMEEILYELRTRSPALNAGRWDYLFSCIKTLRARPGFVLPDRNHVTMETPFLWAYTQRLVQSCHRRGAYAIGGMAALVPSRKDPAQTEAAVAAVRKDKLREANEGFDGTWVAHPDLVPVARAAFAEVLGERTQQLHRMRGAINVGAPEMLFLHVPSGAATESGLRANVRVSLAYLSHWLAGTGCVALDALMEDTATAEIARAQVWQWVRQGVVFEDARTVTPDLVRSVAREELSRLRSQNGAADGAGAHLDEARALFEEVALGDEFVEFLTIPAMRRLG